jgi:D-alanyl-D-alanine carboxypeptidase/D-alanyl-D-alanine-endopeptidase (penicillin-binding protein 4)
MDHKDYNIVDGSGVSLYDYISPDLLIRFLKYAYNNKILREVIYPSLPVAGVDGTLKNRMKNGNVYSNVHAKTGTVTGVSSLAGYLQTVQGHMLAFVIINQNNLNERRAHQFQDRICRMLTE